MDYYDVREWVLFVYSQSKSCLLCASAVGHQQKAVPNTFERVAHVRQYRAQSGPPEIQLFEFAAAGGLCKWRVRRGQWSMMMVKGDTTQEEVAVWSSDDDGCAGG